MSVRRSNLLQTVVTVLIALTVTAAALLSSQAAGEWGSALREEIKRSAATLEILEYVYGDEAPQALRIAVAEVRARQLRLQVIDPGTGGALAASEATTETQLAGQSRLAHQGKGGLVDGDRYRLTGGGYDVARRIGDAERAGGQAVSLDPGRAQASGDRAQRWATLISAVVVPLILGYLLLAVINQRRRLRTQPGRTSGDRSTGDRVPAADDAGLIPQPLGHGSPRRFAITLPVLAWTVLTAIAPAQLYYANQEQRATNLAARQAVQLTTDIAGSHVASTFQIESQRVLLTMEARSYAREFAVIDMTDSGLASAQRAIAVAERAGLPQLQQIVAAMTRPAEVADGVNARTRDIITSRPESWNSLIRQQNEQADRAKHAGLRSNILQLALLLAALSLSLFAFAATQSLGGSTIVGRAACGLLLAAVVAAGAGVVV